MLAVTQDHHHAAPARSRAYPVPALRPAASAADTDTPAAMMSGRHAFGEVGVEIRTNLLQRVTRLTPDAQMVHVLVPLAGELLAVTAGGVHRMGRGKALLLAMRERVDCTWLAESAGIILHVPRAGVQAAQFRARGEPRRIGAIDHGFEWGEADQGFGAALELLLAALASRPADGEQARARIGEALLGGLADALMEAPPELGVFPFAASVKRAIDELQRAVTATPEDLARAAGVTLPMLRRNIRETTGVTLTCLVQSAQLDWARARLESDRESRAVAGLAEAAGFRSARMFNRLYRARFGETPTQTRARVFARG